MEALSKNFYLILFIGLFYGLLVGGTMYIASYRLPILIAAALAFAIMHLLNRFLHMDGLSDLGDGMVCGGDAERRRSAMKDSKTGAGGVGYAIVFGLLSFACLGSLWGQAVLILPLLAEIANKNAMVLCASGGKAREGLGNMFISNTGRKQAAISMILCLGLGVLMVLIFDGLLIGDWGAATMAVPVVAVLTSSIVGLAMSALAEKNFGAVNGDVLGATNEISRPLTLMMMLLVIL